MVLLLLGFTVRQHRNKGDQYMILLEAKDAQLLLNYLQNKPLPAKETIPLINILTSARCTKDVVEPGNVKNINGEFTSSQEEKEG